MIPLINLRSNSSRQLNTSRLNRFLITRRNTQVTDSLLAAWGSNARVFCVSNKLYADHRFNDIEEANGYRALSGITELRRYCQSVPADAQFRATVAYIKNDVPALLGSINQWVLAGSSGITVARAELLRGVLVEAETTLGRVRSLSLKESSFRPKHTIRTD